MNPKLVVFVGQGPNQTAWNKAVTFGLHVVARDPMTPVKYPSGTDRLRAIEKVAEAYCARIALTGSVGTKLSVLLDVPLSRFWKTYPRRNLNAKWGGKKGKGDKFDPIEGQAAARAINAEPFERVVLLGEQVQRCFGFSGEPLEVRENKDLRKTYLLFPHPSGINLWWNEEFNRFRARKRLREFLEITNP